MTDTQRSGAGAAGTLAPRGTGGAALTGLAWDAEALGVPQGLHRVLIHLDQTDGVHVREDAAVEAAGADLGWTRR